MHDNWGFDADLFHELVTPSIVLTLLDERERNQQYIKSRDQENEDIALTVGKLRVELEAEKQRAKDLFMENARLKSGIAGLIHLGIRYADVEVMRIAGDAQLSTPCTDSIINSIATWSLRLAMEKEFPDEEWRSADLRKILMGMAKDGTVSKDTYASRIGQAVWRLEVR
ncbi:ead/Ea22-like family protein [Escherichia coli]|uniref:ead/Ea22-like family protein n=1 Tax=Escherichia coli TaxID=562 RepID=UPI0028DAB58F|nr:ead/Ea22-like family protein [Escherichia coli]MDT8495127.1 ead/Ea22-like family protein [Escherichia coli]MDT8536400.1 ead/Ea22-like family protein [Escherichia coli]MDT8558019.1 ead/Ea22-like family protein [Escherichia coli]